MKKILMALSVGSLLLSFDIALADEHEGDAGDANVATPVEIFTCKMNDGKSVSDLQPVYKQFNAWADNAGLNDYSAWQLVPYYASAEQEFDVIWLGGSASAQSMGRAQDDWLATGGKVQQAFDRVNSCDNHALFATLQIKKPPKRENPSNIVIAFTDCNMQDGVSFSDVYEPLMEWGKYKEEHGSTAGMWVMFPSYGGGGEEFDFKFVSAHQNLADQGADWDQYSKDGWEKAGELFAGKLECDSARVYLATSVRMAAGNDE